MNSRSAIRTCASMVGVAFLVCSARIGYAQSASDLVGTWEPVSIVNTSKDGVKTELFGPTPKGIAFFASDGRFSQIENRPGLPKFASGNRMQGTPEENATVVQNTIAYFGTYTVADKTLIMRIEGGTWAGWIGTEQKRPIPSFSGDQFTMSVTASGGGTNEAVFRRLR
jgi:hypothetical protein